MRERKKMSIWNESGASMMNSGWALGAMLVLCCPCRPRASPQVEDGFGGGTLVVPAPQATLMRRSVEHSFRVQIGPEASYP